MNSISEAPALQLRAWVILVVLLTSLLGIGNRGLLVPDESREAAILLEMARERDFVVPHLAGRPFVEKPPLYYFVGTLVHDVASPWLGIEAIAMATSALFGLATLAACWVLARCWLSPQRALLAVVFLALSEDFVDNAHFIRSDIALLCMVAWAVACFSLAYLKGQRVALIGGALFTGLALLAKGLVGPGMIFPAWAACVVLRVRRAPTLNVRAELLWHTVALCVFVLVTAPWMLALHQADPVLWKAWFYDNQFGRVAGTSGLGHDTDGPRPFFYLIALCGSTVPWTPLVFGWVWCAIRDWRSGRAKTINGFLGAWILGVLVLLTASSTKRNLYLLPLMPAFALAAAAVFPASLAKWFTRLLRIAPHVVLVVVLSFAFAPWLPDMDGSSWQRLAHFIPESGSLPHIEAFILAALLLLLIVKQRALMPMELCVCAAAFLHWFVLCVTIPAYADYMDPRKALAAIDQAVQDQSEANIAGFGLTEMQRGWLYVYGDHKFADLSLERAREVLLGRDPEFAGLLVGRQQSLDELNVPARSVLDVHLDPELKSRARLSLLVPQ